MNKVANYLQEHLVGEVMTSESARKYFSTDASVLTLTPQIVIYPRNTSDIRKVARFCWQMAERGKILPVTARGRGTDQAGGALGSGIMLVFPAHMDKLLELDTGKGVVRVQPGALYKLLQTTLNTHGKFLPPYPASIDYSTIGGAVANNAAGEKSVKYGATVDFVRELDVVLANGELIRTHRLTKRELSKKKGLTSFEGEIYRQLDGLLSDNQELLQSTAEREFTKNSSGYNLARIKRKDGSFDLTPLFVGSQGTLGVITQITLNTESHNSSSTLVSAHFETLAKAQEAVNQLLPIKPSALEMVDKHLLEFIHKNNPRQLKDLVNPPFPGVILLIEFDDADRKQKRQTKRAVKVLKPLATEFSIARDEQERDALWKIRHSAATVIWHTQGKRRALPIIEDGAVPPSRFGEYLKSIYELFAKHKLEVAVWGHAGDANLHLQPFLDLASTSDRQTMFKLMDEYYALVIKLGGTIAGEHNDGRLRAPYVADMHGADMYNLLVKVKQIFDPYGTLNPGVKISSDKAAATKLLRREYTIEHLADHMPRT